MTTKPPPKPPAKPQNAAAATPAPAPKKYAKGDGMTTDKPRLPGDSEMPDAYRPGVFPAFKLTPVGTLPSRAIPSPPVKKGAGKKPRR